jgi:hypothetical protein
VNIDYHVKKHHPLDGSGPTSAWILEPRGFWLVVKHPDGDLVTWSSTPSTFTDYNNNY